MGNPKRRVHPQTVRACLRQLEPWMQLGFFCGRFSRKSTLHDFMIRLLIQTGVLQDDGIRLRDLHDMFKRTVRDCARRNGHSKTTGAWPVYRLYPQAFHALMNNLPDRMITRDDFTALRLGRQLTGLEE